MDSYYANRAQSAPTSNIDYQEARCLDAPERQSLTITVQELSYQAGQTRELAERLRMALDSQYYHSSLKDCANQQGQTPEPALHLCENLDVISGRLSSANANLGSLLEFVGR